MVKYDTEMSKNYQNLKKKNLKHTYFLFLGGLNLLHYSFISF